MTQWGLDTLFNPAKRHMDEEKQRLQSTREEVGDASGGKRIDLESGKVHIRRAGSEDADSEDAESEDGESEDGESEDADGGKAAGGKRAAVATGRHSKKDAPSAAAMRAAQRRGRQPRP